MAITVDPSADGIATVWFDEADKRVNTLAREVLEELSAVLDQLAAQDGLRGVVFASRKPTTFLAGADLRKVRQMDQAAFDAYVAQGQAIYNRIEQYFVPTAAAINGHCLGGGLELALACRIRVAADVATAQIGLPETAIGLIPAWGGTVRFPRRIGYAQAVPMLLASRRIGPQEALRLGLVDELVPAGELVDRARYLLASGGQTESASRAAGHDESITCEPLIDAAVAQTRPTLSAEEISMLAVDRLIEVLRAGCRGGLEAGLRAEREAASALFAAGDCHQRLDRFFARK